MNYIPNDRIARALTDRGLVPPECRLLEVQVEVDGALAIRYERLVTAEELRLFADALKEVADEALSADRSL